MRRILNSFTAIIAFTVAIWFFSALAILYFIDDWSVRGTFGDLFGAVNALFSGLAFAGLLFSLFENRKQIAQQKKRYSLLKRNDVRLSKKSIDLLSGQMTMCFKGVDVPLS